MLKKSSKSKSGQYPIAFKLKAIKRVERGEGVLLVARELDSGGFRRQCTKLTRDDRICDDAVGGRRISAIQDCGPV